MVDDILNALDAQHAELAGIVDACEAVDWERPTRCVGWDVAAVLVHLAETDEIATRSAHGEFGELLDGFLGDRDTQTVPVDDAAAAQVDLERAAGGDAIRDRWHRAARDACGLRGRRSAPARHVGIRATLPADAATTRLSECWIDTDDIGSALGMTLPPTDRCGTLPGSRGARSYAFARADITMAGPVALELTGPSGEEWRYQTDAPALTTITGSAAEFCKVAPRRVDPDATDLVGTGPNATAVLRLVRTYAQ